MRRLWRKAAHALCAIPMRLEMQSIGIMLAAAIAHGCFVIVMLLNDHICHVEHRSCSDDYDWRMISERITGNHRVPGVCFGVDVS